MVVIFTTLTIFRLKYFLSVDYKNVTEVVHRRRRMFTHAIGMELELEVTDSCKYLFDKEKKVVIMGLKSKSPKA